MCIGSRCMVILSLFENNMHTPYNRVLVRMKTMVTKLIIGQNIDSALLYGLQVYKYNQYKAFPGKKLKHCAQSWICLVFSIHIVSNASISLINWRLNFTWSNIRLAALTHTTKPHDMNFTLITIQADILWSKQPNMLVTFEKLTSIWHTWNSAKTRNHNYERVFFQRYLQNCQNWNFKV